MYLVCLGSLVGVLVDVRLVVNSVVVIYYAWIVCGLDIVGFLVLWVLYVGVCWVLLLGGCLRLYLLF